MFYTICALVVMAIACENAADILANVDLLQRARDWFKGRFPKLSKLADCRYCISFWLSGLLAIVAPPLGLGYADILVTWLALHRMAVLLGEFTERYLNRAPLRVHLTNARDVES